MSTPRLALAIAMAAALSACAGIPKPGPVSVIRFVDPAATTQFGQGTFFVETAPGVALPPDQMAPYKAAVARELVRQGYVESDRSGAGIVALVRAESAIVGPGGEKRGPVSVGVGGSTGSYGSGLGLGIGINLGGGGSRETLDTELGVMLRNLQSGATFWEGRAQFSVSVDSPLAARPANATAMADALFREFPGNNGETTQIRVTQ